MKYSEILVKAKEHLPDMTKFLRDMIAIPSKSKKEEKLILRIEQEMEKVGFDRIDIDPMGNILGFLGQGKHLIAMDAHIDTVGVGDPSLWSFDPYMGYEDEQFIGGRGAADQEAGMASMVYAAKIIKELDLTDDFTLVVTGTVQEEDCDGLCWQYIIKEDKLRPEFVVITEPTECQLYRGQRGRMEIKVTTHGLSCHGSAPERGDNAIYKMAPILLELQQLNDTLHHHDILGKGSLTVSEIFFSSPSRCAVADSCWISIDRRLTFGETKESALNEIRSLPSVKKFKAEVELYPYAEPSYKGLTYPTEAYFPSWILTDQHPVVKLAVDNYTQLFRKEPFVGTWTFSTNAVSIKGMFDIPCIGFGPGHEDQAHAPDEKVLKEELVQAAAFYAALPKLYVQKYASAMKNQKEYNVR